MICFSLATTSVCVNRDDRAAGAGAWGEVCLKSSKIMKYVVELLTLLTIACNTDYLRQPLTSRKTKSPKIDHDT